MGPACSGPESRATHHGLQDIARPGSGNGSERPAPPLRKWAGARARYRGESARYRFRRWSCEVGLQRPKKRAARIALKVKVTAGKDTDGERGSGLVGPCLQ